MPNYTTRWHFSSKFRAIYCQLYKFHEKWMEEEETWVRYRTASGALAFKNPNYNFKNNSAPWCTYDLAFMHLRFCAVTNKQSSSMYNNSMNRRSKSAVYVTQYKNLIKIILFVSIFYKFVVNFPLKLENKSGLSISKTCVKSTEQISWISRDQNINQIRYVYSK